MGELHTGSKHPVCGAEPVSYIDHVVHSGNQPTGEVDCVCLVQYNQAYTGLVGLVGIGRLPP